MLGPAADLGTCISFQKAKPKPELDQQTGKKLRLTEQWCADGVE